MRPIESMIKSARQGYEDITTPLAFAFDKYRPQNNNSVRAGVEFVKATVHAVMTVGSAGMLAMAFYYAAQNQDTQVGRNTGRLMESFFGVATLAFARRTYVHGRDGRRALREADEQVITLALKRD